MLIIFRMLINYNIFLLLECWNNKLTPVNAVINIVKKDHKLINDMNKLQKRKETIKKILK